MVMLVILKARMMTVCIPVRLLLLPRQSAPIWPDLTYVVHTGGIQLGRSIYRILLEAEIGPSVPGTNHTMELTFCPTIDLSNVEEAAAAAAAAEAYSIGSSMIGSDLQAAPAAAGPVLKNAPIELRFRDMISNTYFDENLDILMAVSTHHESDCPAEADGQLASFVHHFLHGLHWF